MAAQPRIQTEEGLRVAYEQCLARLERQAEELRAAKESLRQQAQAARELERALQQARQELQNQADRQAADLQRAAKESETAAREQKRIADALRASEERYRNLVEMAPDNIATLDLRGRITSTNRATCELTGYEFDEVVGKPFWKLGVFRARDIPKYLRLFLSLIRGAPASPVELHCYSTDGTLHILESHFSFMRQDGRVVGLQVISRNVTERKRQEESLRREQDFRNRILEHASEGLCVCHKTPEHPHLAFTVWNRRMTELTGYTIDEINRLGWYQAMYPDRALREKAIQRIAAVGGGDDLAGDEWEITRADGQRRFVLVSTSVVAREGETAHVLALMHDVTESKRAQEALRESEARYRMLVEGIPQLAFRLSPDGLDVELNRCWYDYTGQTPEQARAHGWLAVVHPDDLFRVTEAALHAANTQQPYELEYRLRRASDGSYRWHLGRAVPVLDAEGHVSCWVGAATDIEDLKQAHELLKQAHDQELQRHRAELAHASRLSMMGEMAATLAHELNQPLQAIKTYAFGSVCRIQKKGVQDEELAMALDQINQETDRAAQIIRRVRGFVQKREPTFAAISANRLVEEAVLLSSFELEHHRARIDLQLSPDLPMVVGDPIEVEQVIMNLVRNGLEAMDDMPVEDRVLRISTGRHDAEMVRIAVCDCGKGIGPEELAKVFQPFFTTKRDGMGMGLAISRSIVRGHGGSLWVTIEEGSGCTFQFTLPAAKSD